MLFVVYFRIRADESGNGAARLRERVFRMGQHPLAAPHQQAGFRIVGGDADALGKIRIDAERQDDDGLEAGIGDFARCQMKRCRLQFGGGSGGQEKGFDVA